jgi:chromosome segregation ATPase
MNREQIEREIEEKEQAIARKNSELTKENAELEIVRRSLCTLRGQSDDATRKINNINNKLTDIDRSLRYKTNEDDIQEITDKQLRLNNELVDAMKDAQFYEKAKCRDDSIESNLHVKIESLKEKIDKLEREVFSLRNTFYEIESNQRIGFRR